MFNEFTDYFDTSICSPLRANKTEILYFLTQVQIPNSSTDCANSLMFESPLILVFHPAVYSDAGGAGHGLCVPGL